MLDVNATTALALFRQRTKAFPISRFVVFGSRSRGQQRSDSDIDVAVVLDQPKIDRTAVTDALADIAYSVMLDTGELISPLPLTRHELAAPPTPRIRAIIREIERDGLDYVAS